MEKNHSILSPVQHSELKRIIAILVERYQPVRIICFASRFQSVQSVSCFMQPENTPYSTYYLLMITKDTTRIENEAQDYLTNHFKRGAIVIMAHNEEKIKEALALRNRFFSTILSLGTLIYSYDGLPAALCEYELPEIDPVQVYNESAKYYEHRRETASGFYNAALSGEEPESFNICVFLLHQAVEQTLIMLIKIFTGYRSDIHSLIRLIRICECFEPKTGLFFKEDTEEDKRLFQVLHKSYNNTRYNDDFEVDEIDAIVLTEKVERFISWANELCERKIEVYRLLAQSATNETN